MRHDTEAYEQLPESGRKRAYHPSIHTTTYFKWVYDELSKALLSDTRCDIGRFDDLLEEIERALKRDEARFEPREDYPIEADD